MSPGQALRRPTEADACLALRFPPSFSQAAEGALGGAAGPPSSPSYPSYPVFRLSHKEGPS